MSQYLGNKIKNSILTLLSAFCPEKDRKTEKSDCCNAYIHTVTSKQQGQSAAHHSTLIY